MLERPLGDADELVRNFLRLAAEKGRIGELEEVHEELERLLAREERVLELELTTAVELSDEEAAEIVKQIEEASGRRVVATRSVDPDHDRRHRRPSRLAAPRRERARPAEPATSRTNREELGRR